MAPSSVSDMLSSITRREGVEVVGRVGRPMYRKGTRQHRNPGTSFSPINLCRGAYQRPCEYEPWSAAPLLQNVCNISVWQKRCEMAGCCILVKPSSCRVPHTTNTARTEQV